MSELEKMVWAAAFAAEFSSVRHHYNSEPGLKRTVDDIDGYSCAEIADIAVDKLREGLALDKDKLRLPNAAKKGRAT